MACESLQFEGESYRGYYTAYTFAFADEDGNPTDVTGWDFSLTFYPAANGGPAGGAAVQAFTVANGLVTVGTTDGLVSVTFPAADSLALDAATYWAEARATDALGLPRLVAWGPWLHHDTGLGGVS